MLPSLGKELFDYAKEASKPFCEVQQKGLISKLRDSFSGANAKRQEVLALCVFDMALMVYFNEVNEFCDDNDLASLLADSLLFEATGIEAEAATEMQLLFEGTQNVHGLHKYFLSKEKKPHLHPVNWVFGKELSAITSGSPLDIAIVSSVGPFSLSFRTHITWLVRYRITGEMPTEDQKKVFGEALAKSEKNLKDLNELVSKVGA